MRDSRIGLMSRLLGTCRRSRTIPGQGRFQPKWTSRPGAQAGMRAIAQTGLRATIAGIACLGVGACASDDDVSPASPPPLESVTGYCHATARENAPALYRCYGAVIRNEPLYKSDDRDLYAVLAATSDLL